MVGKLSSIIIVVSIVVIVGAVAILAGNTIQVPYTGMVTTWEDVPVTRTESFKDREPYTDQECHMQEIKYTESWGDIEHRCLQEECAEHYQVCVEKNFWGNCIQFEDRCSGNQCVKVSLTCALDIRNIDDEGGTFELKGYVVGDNGEEQLVDTVQVYVRAMSTGTATWSYTYYPPQLFNCRARDIDAPSKQVCESVIKYREVDKERQVVSTEKVQKLTEQVKYHSLFEHWGIT